MKLVLVVALGFLLAFGAATASAKVIVGSAKAERLTGTSRADKFYAGKGNDVIFARDKRKDIINCGPGTDVAVVDVIDYKSGCEIKRPPPLPHLVAPLPGDPTKIVKAGPIGSVTTPIPTFPAPPPPTPTPSGEAMPVGNLPGWTQIFTDDFTTDVASWGDCTSYAGGRDCPGLPAVYRSKWWSYPAAYQDTREKIAGDGGFYRPANYSMSGGVLKLPLRRSSGTSQSAAPIPKIPGERLTYGRYAIRFKTTTSPAFKVAWLLNPSTAEGRDEEIDFPEADLDSNICAFNHGPSGGNDYVNCSGPPTAGAWHTAVTEWTPGRLKFYLDGKLFGETTNQVSNVGMTWVIQSETVLSGPIPDTASADISIDWVGVWKYEPGLPPPPPPPPGAQDFGLVANSDHGNAINGTGKVGGNLLRAEFDASQSLASIQSVIDQARAINVEVVPQISSPWGTASTVAAWAHGLDGIRFIEFGNEDSFSYKGTQNQGGVYGAEAARAILGMAGSGVGLLIQGDDANTGSQWPTHVRNNLNGQNPAGWVIHPYGPGWQERIARNVAMLPFGAPLYITEWGVSSDNGSCLNDNYGFPRCLTYAQAGDTIRSNVEQMFAAFPQIRALMLFQVKDQRGSGSGEREHYFGALRSDLSDKTGLTDDVRYLASTY